MQPTPLDLFTQREHAVRPGDARRAGLFGVEMILEDDRAVSKHVPGGENECHGLLLGPISDQFKHRGVLSKLCPVAGSKRLPSLGITVTGITVTVHSIDYGGLRITVTVHSIDYADYGDCPSSLSPPNSQRILRRPRCAFAPRRRHGVCRKRRPDLSAHRRRGFRRGRTAASRWRSGDGARRPVETPRSLQCRRAEPIAARPIVRCRG